MTNYVGIFTTIHTLFTSDYEMTELLCRGCKQPLKNGEVAYQQVKIKENYEIEHMMEFDRLIFVHKRCMKFRRNL